MIRTMKMIGGEWAWDPPFTKEEEAEHQSRTKEMLAEQSPPMSSSDREFLAGHGGEMGKHKNPKLEDILGKVCKAHGGNPKGKVYIGGLARFPGDPQAFVSGRGDIERVCAKNGWACHGAVNVDYREPAPDDRKPIDVADDILESHVDSIIDKEPEAAHEDRQELKEKVRQKIKPHWSK